MWDVYQVIQESGTKVESKEANFGSTEASSFEIVPVIPDLTQSRPLPKLPCHLLGPETRTKNFTGREAILSKIEKRLKMIPAEMQRPSFRDAGPRAFALCGLGGMGKSSVATEYIHQHKGEYDAIFWIQADNDNSIAESFGQISKELEILNPSEKNDLVVSHSMAMEWLQNPIMQSPSDGESQTPIFPLAKWLLIFDNADDLDILRDYWPTTGAGAILVTSRDPLAKAYSTLTVGTDLEPLSSEESSSLMIIITGYEAGPRNKQEATELASRLGGLPLAITQIASMIGRRDLTFKEFLDIYEEEESKMELLTYQDKYGHTLWAVWGLEGLSSGA